MERRHVRPSASPACHRANGQLRSARHRPPTRNGAGCADRRDRARCEGGGPSGGARRFRSGSPTTPSPRRWNAAVAGHRPGAADLVRRPGSARRAAPQRHRGSPGAPGSACWPTPAILHADTSPLGLASEHRETEALLRAAGVPFVLLRNGWYTENYTAAIPAALAHHALIGSAGRGPGRVRRAGGLCRRGRRGADGGRDLGWPHLRAGGGRGLHPVRAGGRDRGPVGPSRSSTRTCPRRTTRRRCSDAGLPEALAGLLADSDTGASKGRVVR